jgi:hypothetical protein
MSWSSSADELVEALPVEIDDVGLPHQLRVGGR